jgi:predicted AAA+ superfamily ATPase
MFRIGEEKLLLWRRKKTFKPLILMGARQVGKTWLMKNLGAKHFENFIYINFEKDQSLKRLFESDLNVNRIVNTLSTLNNQQIEDGKTLLIFDEIQEAPGALTSLKYFAEDRPSLHVISAGSLLGVSQDRGSFPVGKVEFLKVHPMSFLEFLLAMNEKGLYQLLEGCNFSIISNFRDRYIELLKLYYVVGGMPEVVSKFTQSPSQLEEVKNMQESILNSYMQDFAKHAPSVLIPKILSVWKSLVSQLAKENKKFVYGILKSGARARDYEQAIDWLENYGLIHKIYAVNKLAFPLQAYRDLKSFKIYALDVGLLSRMANLEISIVLEDNSFFQEFKGALSEQFVLQELKVSNFESISYWTNQNGVAELDFVFEKNRTFYPLEVKANENLQSKSLKIFHQKEKEIHCFRTSLSNYRKESWMTNVPLYAISSLTK